MKILVAVSLCVAAFILSCAANKSADTHDPGRWRPYAGCNEGQCRSWNSACEADCMNESRRKNIVDADVCITQCRDHMRECNQSCTARPGE